MSCIAAINTGDAIYMGGDSAVADHTERGIVVTTPPISKVLRKGSMLIGLVGLKEDMDALRLNLRDPGGYSLYWTVRGIRRIFRKAMVLGGWDKYGITEDQSTVMIGYYGSLYILYPGKPVERINGRYVTMGSGSQAATDSLARTEQLAMDPVWRIKKVLKAASQDSRYVQPPFYVEKLENEIVDKP